MRTYIHFKRSRAAILGLAATLLASASASALDGTDLTLAEKFKLMYDAPTSTGSFLGVDDPSVFTWGEGYSAASGYVLKMKLDGNNVLTLRNAAGTADGFKVDPSTGRMDLAGTAPSLYAGGSAVFNFGTGGALQIAGTTASTSSATGALTVAGGLGVATDSYINGLRVGRGGTGAGNPTSVVVGGGGLGVNTGAGNTAVGNQAMSLNTTGSQNAAFGNQAMTKNTTGSRNTGLGSQALFNGQFASDLTGVGYGAVASATTGSDNTGVGSSALFSTTTGLGNSALGRTAMFTNVSGSYNSAIGGYSLYNNTTGSRNAAIGYYSLYQNSTYSDNTALGAWAGGQIATAGNTLVGSYAGSNIASTVGGNSVAIGFNALSLSVESSASVGIGWNAGKLPSGSGPHNTYGSVFIGAQSAGKDASETNTIVIGAAALGEGTNTTVIGNSLTTSAHIYGTLKGPVNVAPADPAGAPDGDSLTVSGTTHLNGKVILSQVQGDIAMGINGN